MLALLTHLLLGPAATAATQTLSEELPSGFLLDGDVSEWTRPPDLTLGPEHQLSGEGVSGPDDFSARIWWNMGLDGLVFAADVRDDAVLLAPKDGDPLYGDHLSLWIALPPAELPPVGFASERGLSPVLAAADCAAAEDPDACKSWLAAQAPRRARLGRLFVRQYTFTSAEVVETWSGLCVPAPAESPTRAQGACRSSVTKLRKVEGGYQLEARIALSEFPATHENPMNYLRLLVDAVDNDVGLNEQESAFSSDADADPNRPATLPRYDLRRPPLFDSDPPVFAALELYDPSPGLFYFPALKLAQAYTFENLALGGQRTPALPSPAITALDWSRPRRLATIGELEVYELPAEGAGCAGCVVGRRLALVEEDRVVGTQDLGRGTVRGFALRGDALHVIVAESGPSDPLVSGSPREHRVTAYAVGEDAAITTLFQDSLIEGEPDDGFVYTGVSVQVTPDGSAFGFVGKRAHAESPDQSAPFSRLTQIDVSSGQYLAGEDAL